MATRRQEKVTLDLYEGPLRKPSLLQNPLSWTVLAVVAGIGIFIALSGRESPFSDPTTVPPAAPAGISNGAKLPGRTEGSKDAGQEARTIIGEVRRQGGEYDLSSVFTRAGELQKKGKLVDAYLLYFFAAREGHGLSAFMLGGMLDPNHFSPEVGLIERPDAGQALKWYRVAAKNGNPAAKDRVLELQRWAEERARAGDLQAQQLTLGWR